jgi:hypothetical protein
MERWEICTPLALQVSSASRTRHQAAVVEDGPGEYSSRIHPAPHPTVLSTDAVKLA